MDVSSHTSWLSLDTIQPYYYLKSPTLSGVMLFGTLTYTLGCFPLDIRPYHRTSETIILNNTFLSLTHIGTHLYALLTSLIVGLLLPTSPPHQYTWCIEIQGQELCVWIFTVPVLFIILPSWGFMIGHALTCFADNQLSRRSISFSLLKSTHQRLM